MDFYVLLQQIMDEKSLSIPDVARASNLSDSTIRSIITRKQKSVALPVAMKISKGLNISLEVLNGEVEAESDTVKSGVFKITDNEKTLIIHYRERPELQDAVNILLGIEVPRPADD